MKRAFSRDLSRVVCQVVLLALFLDTSGARELAALDRGPRLVAGSELGAAVEVPAAGEGATAWARWQGAVDSAGGAIAEGFSAARRAGGEAVARVAAVSAAVQDEAAGYLRLLTDQAGAVRGAEPSGRAAVPSRPPPPMPPGLELPAPGAAAAGSGIVGASALVDLSQVPLLVGPNLISLPNQPPDPDPAVVLAPIAGQFTQVFAYDNCDAADPWKVYDPADPAGSDLAAIDHTLGLWVDATAATSLPSDGVQPPSTQIQLCTGWNLVGYPLMQPRPVPAALASIAGKYLRVFGFELGDAADEWEVFDVAAPEWANDLQMMQPGRGYWVLATEDVVLDYQNEGAPPTVEILSPAPREEIASIVDVVGTVQSNLLEEWTLAYRPSGTTVTDAVWVEFARGDFPVTAAVLGRFDPTLLLNGMYDIRLQARDFQGQIVETIVPVAVDGERKVGAFTLSFSDLRLPLSGLDLEVIRTYDSREKQKRDFGVGWTLDIKQGSWENNVVPGDGWEIVNSAPPIVFPCVAGVETQAHLTTIRLSDQEVYRFRLEVFNTGPQLGGCFGQARFAFVDGPVPGATLTILGNTDVFWGSGTNELIDLIAVEIYNPRDVRLRTRDGREYDFVLGQGVSRVRDTNGNELTITPSSIAHSSGVSISMTRDAEDRITEITDPMGDSMRYEYDAAGDLVAYTDRGGHTTTFVYDGDHRLEDFFDPLGNRGVRSEYDAEGRLVSATDASGNTINLSHDPQARREVISNRLGAIRVLEYDARGNVTREIDELGNETLRTFDLEDNVLTETDPLGRTTTFTYSAENDVQSITDALGNVSTFTYDAAGRLLTATDPRGNVTTNVYDASGNLNQTTDPLGNVTTFTYDARGNPLTATDALGQVTTSTYDSRGNLTSQTDPLGNVTTFTYDARGNQISEARTRTIPGTGGAPPASETLTTTFVYDALDQLVSTTAADGGVVSHTYDSLGRIVSRTDPLGRTTSMAYDAQGRLTATTFPDGTTETSTYDAEGRVLTRRDRAGRVTSFAYDAAGRLLTTTFPDGATVANGYDDAGQLVSRTDERLNTWSFVYDDAGRRTKVVDPLGNTTTTAYDAAGNPVSVTDALGRVTSFAYDDADRRTVTTLADLQTIVAGWDALGRRVSETDQAGRTTTFGYDALGRLTSVTDALAQVTSYTYDEVGNRLSQTDARGNTTSLGYDEVGRLISRTLPDGAVESMAYNPDGTLAARTDFLGRTTTFAYDVNARLTRRSHPDATSVTWTYTPTGRRASYADSRGTTSFTYDDRDRVLSMTTPDAGSLNYAYDLAGNRTSLTAAVGATTLASSYTYDALNRLETVTDSQGGVYTHTYDDVGNRATLAYPNGITTTTLYDPVNRLTSLATVDAGSAVLQSFGFTLDVTGRRTSIAESDGSGPTRTLDYAYDALHRLTRDRVTDPASVLLYQEDFAYDPVGNRTGLTRDEGTGPVPTSYTYDSRDRLLTEGSAAYTWDANGNLASEAGVATFAWDTLDRLDSVTLSDGTTVVTAYDPDGNRVRTETTPPGGATETVHYLVDTSGPLSHVVAESDASGSLLTHYVRGDELLSLWRPATSQRRYFHADGVGSVRLLTDPAGTITDTYTYTAFGVEEARTGIDPQPYRFTGEPYDPNTGFQYHRARWLDPGVGRFLSVDPFDGVPHEPETLHRYLYVGNRPTDAVDPTGRFQLSLSGLLVSMAIGAILNGIAAYRADQSLSQVAKSILIGAVEGALWAVAGGAIAFALRWAWNAAKAAKVSINIFRFGKVPLVGFRSPIAPFKTLQQVTKGHKGAIQAHHILEQRHLRAWGYTAAQIRQVPSQVLTRPEHVRLTAQLRAALPFGTQYTRAQVWAAYQNVYRAHPQYLRAIRHYF